VHACAANLRIQNQDAVSHGGEGNGQVRNDGRLPFVRLGAGDHHRANAIADSPEFQIRAQHSIRFRRPASRLEQSDETALSSLELALSYIGLVAGGSRQNAFGETIDARQRRQRGPTGGHFQLFDGVHGGTNRLTRQRDPSSADETDQ
jgi:hypothetical protein